jgi:DNA polymerase IIIc chi subunit
VARLELHTLQSEKRAGRLVGLLERFHKERTRVVVWIADEGRRQIFDDYLWTYQKLAFLPHLLWNPGLGDVDEAVVLVGEPANPNRATVLVVGDDLPPGGWAATFDEVHDLIAPGPAGEERRAFWKRWQEDPTSASESSP